VQELFQEIWRFPRRELLGLETFKVEPQTPSAVIFPEKLGSLPLRLASVPLPIEEGCRNTPVRLMRIRVKLKLLGGGIVCRYEIIRGTGGVGDCGGVVNISPCISVNIMNGPTLQFGR
jgi:hypothetical protein